jgi:hypothetical protein
MQFNQYLAEESVTYEDYCIAVDYVFGINEGMWDNIKDKASGVVAKVLSRVKDDLIKIGSDFQLGVNDIINAFKNKNVFHLFKALGFSFHKLIKAVDAFTALVRDGLLHVFKKLHKTGAFQKLKSGAIKMDELLEQHPILNRVTGVAVAGLLFYIWLNMTFIGNMDYDFDFSNMGKALAGNFSLEQLFASPEGLMLGTLFATGSLISAPWLGKLAYNLVLALVYTGLKNAKGKDVPQKIISKMQTKVQFVRT